MSKGRLTQFASCPTCLREWPDGKIGLFCPSCGLLVLHGSLDSWRAPNGRNYRKELARVSA